MDKRHFLKLTSIVATGSLVAPILSCNNSQSTTNEPSNNVAAVEFSLPALNFAPEALAPNIDARTMGIHHGKHHAGYVKKLNAALKGSNFVGKSIESILANVTKSDAGIRNNGGGHYNHSLFWSILGPGGGKPSGDIADAINRDFGSFEKFKEAFQKAGKSVFGSGWAWLCVDEKKKLFITSTPNQDNPLMTKLVAKNGTPILGVDVWEHAYYLNYQNRRGEYLSNIFNVINWEAVGENLKKIG